MHHPSGTGRKRAGRRSIGRTGNSIVGGDEMEQVFDPRVLMASLYVFALAAFLGYQIISRVPPLLHTPLMSATNALSAISVVGAIVVAGRGHNNESPIATWL